MAEAQEAKKSKTEYTPVVMTDGSTVEFAGKRKVNKDYTIDQSKIEVDGDVIQLKAGAIKLQMAFRNGTLIDIPIPLSLLAQFAAHGAAQKFGDELATSSDKPMSEDDMVLAIEDLNKDIQAGRWGRERAAGGGGVAGASLVLQAILEVQNARRAAAGKELMTMAQVKEFIEKRLAAEADKPEDQRITRPALYKSFKNPATETGKVYARLEAEKDAKSSKVDASAELEAMDAA